MILMVLISNMAIAFLKFQPKNTQIEHFWSQSQAFLFLHEIWQLGKVDGVDFKYDNSFVKIPTQKYPSKAFLVPKLGIFTLKRNLAISL